MGKQEQPKWEPEWADSPTRTRSETYAAQHTRSTGTRRDRTLKTTLQRRRTLERR